MPQQQISLVVVAGCLLYATSVFAECEPLPKKKHTITETFRPMNPQDSVVYICDDSYITKQGMSHFIATCNEFGKWVFQSDSECLPNAQPITTDLLGSKHISSGVPTHHFDRTSKAPKYPETTHGSSSVTTNYVDRTSKTPEHPASSQGSPGVITRLVDTTKATQGSSGVTTRHADMTSKAPGYAESTLDPSGVATRHTDTTSKPPKHPESTQGSSGMTKHHVDTTTKAPEHLDTTPGSLGLELSDLYMSTRWNQNGDTLAVDGKESTCMITGYQQKPWAALTFQSVLRVNKVDISGRFHGGVQVRIGDEMEKTGHMVPPVRSSTLCGTLPQQKNDEVVGTLQCWKTGVGNTIYLIGSSDTADKMEVCSLKINP